MSSLKNKLICFIIILLLPLNYFFLERSRIAKPMLKEEKIFLSEPFLKIFSGEFKGLVADFLVINLSSYYGGIIIEKNEAVQKEFDYMYKVLKAASNLDPYYYDIYYFAQTIIAWDAKMPEKAIELLKVGMEKRKNDWIIPYWIGFDYYYFLNNRKMAAYYFKEAAKRPGASDLIASMTAIAAYEGGETEMAIFFLEDIIKRTDDEYKKAKFLVRLDALKKILYLENAVKNYEKRFYKKPEHLSELVQEGIIKKIPKDPYGGEFYISEEGKIKTTSGLRFVRRK
jgi:hypothetical protein